MAFLIGYAVANVLGGALPRRRNPKYVTAWTFALWSVATFHIGMTNSITVLLICRVLLGIGEGIYWPQQSRFATAWFAPNERTEANAVSSITASSSRSPSASCCSRRCTTRPVGACCSTSRAGSACW